MNEPPACLASLEALWAAPLQDVAVALLWLGFADKLGQPAPETDVSELTARVAEQLPDLQLGMIRIYSQPPLAYIVTVILEAVLLLEQRYLVSRHSDRSGESVSMGLRLLRPGRAALESGDPAKALA